MAEVERATIDAMSATERYNTEVAELRGLMDEGYLTTEQYARAVGILDQELQAAQFDSVRRGIDGMADSIAQAIANGEDLGDTMRNVLQQIASDLLSSGLQQAFGALFGGMGGGGGNLLSNIFGGFRANGGPVMPSRAYVVGERGPELFVPSSAGNIVPNGGGGGVEVNIYGAPAEPEVTRSGGRIDIDFRRAMAQTVAAGGLDRELRQRRAKGAF